MEQGDDGTFRPSLVLAVREPKFQGNFVANVIPAESLLSVRSLRRRSTGFGKSALFRFSCIEDVSEYFMAIPKIKNAQGDNAGVSISGGSHDKTADSLPVYDKLHGCLTVSVDEDMKLANERYWELVAERHAILDRDLESRDYSGLIWDLVKGLESIRFSKLNADDIILVSKRVVISELGNGDDQVYVLEEGERLRGAFVGFDIARFPTPEAVEAFDSDGEENDSLEDDSAWGLGVVLRDCSLLDANSSGVAPVGKGEPLVVALSTATDARFTKLDLEATLESIDFKDFGLPN